MIKKINGSEIMNKDYEKRVEELKKKGLYMTVESIKEFEQRARESFDNVILKAFGVK